MKTFEFDERQVILIRKALITYGKDLRKLVESLAEDERTAHMTGVYESEIEDILEVYEKLQNS